VDVIAPDRADAIARVQFTEQLGGETFLYCDVGNDGDAERIVIKRPGQQRFGDNEVVSREEVWNAAVGGGFPAI
jgi:multiple sugar transport system ATP-binding protein/lactose/L-arabinose transport system ATP-binding protein